MRRPQGYAVVVDPATTTVERDTFTCAHCQRIVFVKPFASASDSGGWCGNCAKPICGPCADLCTCVPFERKLERYERAHRFATSAGLVLR